VSPTPDPVRQALSDLLRGDSALEELTNGVHHRLAPQGTEPPYTVFHRQAGTAVWTFQSRGSEEALWLVKGVARGNPSQAEAIDAACQELLDGRRLTLPGGQVTVLRDSAVDFGEPKEGALWGHVGSLYRVYV